MNRRTRLRLSLRALGGQLGAQWERERRDTLFLMAPVLIATLPHLRWLPWWVGAGFMVLFAWRLGLLFSGRWLPRASVRWAAALASTAAVWAHYGTLIGREPGVALLVLFLGLKLMEMHAHRDLFAVIFLSLFLLLATFLHSQSIGTAAIVLIGLAGLLSAMLTMQYRRQEAPIGRRLRLVGALMLQALPVAAVLFILFPRTAGPLWGLPGDASRTRIGLSESMSPGAISELGESREIAFQVEFDGPVPAPATLYWRGPAFGDFDGKTWRALPQTKDPLPQMQLRVDDGKVFAYTVSQEPSDRPWLFVLEMPVRVTMPAPFSARLLPDLQLIADSPPDERIRFRAESSLEWRAGLNENPASLQNWLGLPAGFNPRTLALAARWRRSEDEGVPADERALRLVERALAMFRNEPFRYTLRPPQSGHDSVDDFLFEQRAGFCEHFASAFVVLMRALDIPARVVTGYQGGERDPSNGRWLVRQADAHAWSEVWLPGHGWQRVDPTAAVAPERIEHGVRLEPGFSGADGFDAASPMLVRLRLRFDRIANRWSQWLLSYDSARQRQVFGRLGLPIGDWRALAAALALSLTVAIGAIAVLTLRPRSSRDPVQRSWSEFCKRLARADLERFPHETALAYLRRVEHSLDPDRIHEARHIVSLYNALRYGGRAEPHAGAGPYPDPAPDGHDVRHLRRCVKQFRP